MDPAASGIEYLLANNPWSDFANLDFLPSDTAQVEAFNKRYQNELYQIRGGVIPEPFVGSPRAPIWLPNLNPGFDNRDLEHCEKIKSAQRTNLLLQASDFWLLSHDCSNTPGHVWWMKRFKELIEETDNLTVRKNVFCLEYFPYHSCRFKPMPKRLGRKVPSQDFTAAILKAGIAAKKRIIVMRGRALWECLVQELRSYPYEKVRNPRCATISRKNFDNFDSICNLLKATSSVGGV